MNSKIQSTYTATANGETLDLTTYNETLKDASLIASIVKSGGIIINEITCDDTVGKLIGTITSYGNVCILIKNITDTEHTLRGLYSFVATALSENGKYFDVEKQSLDIKLAVTLCSQLMSKNSAIINNDGYSIKVMSVSNAETPSQLLVEFFNDGTVYLDDKAIHEDVVYKNKQAQI